MAAVKEIQVEVKGAKDLALIGNDDSVWLVVPMRWWDLSTLLFWALMPADKRATITLPANRSVVFRRNARVVGS